MNLKAVSNELKSNFSILLSYIPLDEIGSEHIGTFIRFYKKLFLKLYKQFGMRYATTLTCEIGKRIIPELMDLNDEVDFSVGLQRKTRSILENMEEAGKIDHSKHSQGMSGEFYDALNTLEKEVYLSTFLNTIAGPGEENMLVSISKTCVKLDIGFEEYTQVACGISEKYREWAQKFKKNLSGDAIKF